MMPRAVALALALVLLIGPVLGLTQEAVAASSEAKSHDYWQEFDITFWQTAPFAIFWCNMLERQLATSLAVGGGPNWNLIIGAATLVSAANAAFSADRMVSSTAPKAH